MADQQPEALPFAVFDEFGKGADDRVQDHIRAQVERLQAAGQEFKASDAVLLARGHARNCNIVEHAAYKYLQGVDHKWQPHEWVVRAILDAYQRGAKATPAPSPAPVAQESDERMTDSARAWLEGMSVSVDVSTGDDDIGHRYFGTVTEVMDDPNDKHGVTLLVQDAKPNFDRAGQVAAPAMVPLTKDQMEKGRDQIFSVNNPFCPCDSKTFRKVAEWVEHHHGIGLTVGGIQASGRVGK